MRTTKQGSDHRCLSYLLNAADTDLMHIFDTGCMCMRF